MEFIRLFPKSLPIEEFSQAFFVGSTHYGEVNISPLLFADDTLVCCGAKPDHLHYLCALYLCFKFVSSLMINLAKSELLPMSNVDNADGLVGILGYMVSSLP
jgi:hypothetical protein